MKLVLVTPEESGPRESTLLVALFAAGLERCYVRKPGLARAELAAWLRALPAEFRPRLVLHQHHDLVGELGLGGCHWRDDASAPPVPPADNLISSRSCHDIAAVRAALGRYASVFFAPVFPSISKPDHGPRGDVSFAELSALLAGRTAAERRTNVFALGGVTADHVARCRELGFDGVAVLGAIWQAADPVRAFAQFQTALHRHAA